MKKVLFILSSLIVLVSCSTNRCIESYLKEDMQINKEKKITSVLTDKKLKVSNTLSIYMGRKRGNINTQAKSFDQKDYAFLDSKFKNDTTTEYWSQKQSHNFKFASLVKNGDLSKYLDSSNMSSNNSEVHNFNISKPIFIKNKKYALFSLFVTKQPNSVVEDCVIIMAKKNGNWILLEKVNNSSLH